MKRLPMLDNINEEIQEELFLAGIDISEGNIITGRIGNWEFKRDGTFWNASTKDNEGLVLEKAIELYEKDYPIKGKTQPETYGKVVRAAGHAGGIHPIDWNIGRVDDHLDRLQNLKKNPAKVDRKDLYELYCKGLIAGQRTVDTYHIDTQIGLNEFVKVINEEK